jgi:O-antigen ligase
LLGVGVTNFEDAVDEMVESTLHHKSGWQVAHNTYLQIAAENGVLAFILYLWSLILCLKMNLWSYRTSRRTPQLSDAVTQSFALILMTLMFMVCTAFSNNSCDPHVGVLVGVTAANYLAVRRELQAAQPATVSSAGIAQSLRVPVHRTIPARNAQVPSHIRGSRPAQV